jgi:hypothetical protein
VGYKESRLQLQETRYSFPFATRIFLDDNRIERLDDGGDYGESRFVAVGLVNGSEIVVVYTLREDKIRVISARKADQNEIETYWNR